MILSFSIESMRPMIEAGIRQARGEHVTERVKRQTIRKRTKRYERMIENPARYMLNLQWLAPWLPGSYRMGNLPCLAATPIQITREHSAGRSPWIYVFHDSGQLIVADNPDRPHLSEADDFAYADGFDTLAAFGDYFVPSVGDCYGGDDGAVLIKW